MKEDKTKSRDKELTQRDPRGMAVTWQINVVILMKSIDIATDLSLT